MNDPFTGDLQELQDANRRIAKLEAELISQGGLIQERQSADNAAKLWMKSFMKAKERIAELEAENKECDRCNAILEAEYGPLKERVADLEKVLREIDQDPSQEILTEAQRKILEKGK